MNYALYNKCLRELELTISVFKQQKRLDDFSEFQKRLENAKLSGKGSPILNLLIDLRAYVYNSDIQYIQNMKTPPSELTLIQQRLFDYYIAVCEGKEESIYYTPSAEELKYLEMIKNVDENDINFAANLELDIFKIISKKKSRLMQTSHILKK